MRQQNEASAMVSMSQRIGLVIACTYMSDSLLNFRFFFISTGITKPDCKALKRQTKLSLEFLYPLSCHNDVPQPSLQAPCSYYLHCPGCVGHGPVCASTLHELPA